MLPEYYDRFKIEYTETILKLKEIFEKVIGNGDSVSINEMASLQQNVIDVCNGFEEQWLISENSITHAFEEVCEEIYKFTQGDREALYRVKKDLDRLPKLFDECYDRVERKLAIALIARNEERYIREWIEYHFMVGCEYFYVTDHMSTDGTCGILREYADKGVLEYKRIDGDYLPTQRSTYDDAVYMSRYEFRYLACIDTDEFIVPMKHDSVPDALDAIIGHYEDTPFKFMGSGMAGGVGINWRIFGSSGHATPVDGLVTENYILRGPDDLMVNAHIKTICRPDRVKSFPSAHFAIYESGYWCISEHGSMIPAAFFYDSIGDILRLNHYYTKSESEYKERRLNFVRAKAGRQRLQTEEEVKRANELRDDAILRFVPELKKRLGV